MSSRFDDSREIRVGDRVNLLNVGMYGVSLPATVLAILPVNPSYMSEPYATIRLEADFENEGLTLMDRFSLHKGQKLDVKISRLRKI